MGKRNKAYQRLGNLSSSIKHIATLGNQEEVNAWPAWTKSPFRMSKKMLVIAGMTLTGTYMLSRLESNSEMTENCTMEAMLSLQSISSMAYETSFMISKITFNGLFSVPLAIGVTQHLRGYRGSALPIIMEPIIYNAIFTEAATPLPEHNFLAAAKDRNLNALQKLSREVIINIQDNSGNTAAHLAISHETDLITLEKILNILIDAGDNLDTPNYEYNITSGTWPLKSNTMIAAKTPFDLLKDIPNTGNLIKELQARIKNRQDVENETNRIIGVNHLKQQDERCIADLDKAILENNLATVQKLKKHIANAKSEDKTKWLFSAVAQKSSIVGVLLDEKVPTNAPGKNENSLLHAAVNSGLEMVKIIINRVTDISITKNDVGDTPYHIAAKKNQKEMIDIIAGNQRVENVDAFITDINIRNNDGDTALMVAIQNGYIDLANHLLHIGARANITNNAGKDAIKIALQTGHPYAMELIKKYTTLSIDLNGKDKNGRTALAYSIIYNNEKAFDILMDRGADIYCIDKEKNNIIHLLVATKNIIFLNTFVDKLINKGANVNLMINHSNQFGHSAIHLAIMSGNEDITEALIENGANMALSIRIGINTRDLPLVALPPTPFLKELGVKSIILLKDKEGFKAHVLENGIIHSTKFNYIDNLILENLQKDDESGLVAHSDPNRDSILQTSCAGIEEIKTILISAIEMLFLSGAIFNKAFDKAIERNETLKNLKNNHKLTLLEIGNHLIGSDINFDKSNSLDEYMRLINSVLFDRGIIKHPGAGIIMERTEILKPTNVDIIKEKIKILESTIEQYLMTPVLALLSLWLIRKLYYQSQKCRPSPRELLDEALDKGKLDLLELAIEKGVNIDLPNKAGCYPVNLAIGSQNVAVTKCLIEKNANLRLPSILENNISMSAIEMLFLSGPKFNKAFQRAIEKNKDLKDFVNSYGLTLCDIGSHLSHESGNDFKMNESQHAYLGMVKEIVCKNNNNTKHIIDRMTILAPTIERQYQNREVVLNSDRSPDPVRFSSRRSNETSKASQSRARQSHSIR